MLFPLPLLFFSLPGYWLQYTEQTYTGISSCSSSQSSRCPSGSGYWSCSSITGTAYCSQWWVLDEVCLVWNAAANDWDPFSGCVAAGSTSTGANRYIPSPGRGTNGLAQAGYTLYTNQPSGLLLPSNALTVRVRSNQDPWLVAMRLTSGTGSFGLTTGQKVGSGIALLAVGITFTILPCVAMYALLRCCEHRRLSKRGSYAGGGGTTIVTTTTTMPIGLMPSPAGSSSIAVAMPVAQPVAVGMYPQQQPMPVQPQQPYGYPSQPQPTYQPQYPAYAPATGMMPAGGGYQQQGGYPQTMQQGDPYATYAQPQPGGYYQPQQQQAPPPGYAYPPAQAPPPQYQ